MMDLKIMDKMITDMLIVNIKNKNNISELKQLSILLNYKMDDINEVIDNRIHELEQEDNQ